MKKTYQFILAQRWGSTWVSDTVLYARSCRANAVKMTSSQITCEWFGRAGERRANACFPLTTVAVSQVFLVTSTADRHVRTVRGVVRWWWMCSTTSPLHFTAVRWWVPLMYSHLCFIQIVSVSSSGNLLGFSPFPLLTFLLKSNKEDFDCYSFLDWRV